MYEEEEDPSSKSFFSEIISSVSDVKFSKDGRYILSRDYLTLRIWDINMDSKPIQTISVHDHLRSKLCDLYENDCIFDKFECTFSGSGECVPLPSFPSSPLGAYAFGHNAKPGVLFFSPVNSHVLSGSYNNYFHIYDKEAQTDVVLQADKSAFKAKKIAAGKGGAGNKAGLNKAGGAGANGAKKPLIDTEQVDYQKKILFVIVMGFGVFRFFRLMNQC